jgi:dGTPase
MNCDKLGGLAPKIHHKKMGFKHNLQGVRVTSDLDQLYGNVSGLNLSNFTLWGIYNHSSKYWKKCGFRVKNANGLYICNYPQNKNGLRCKHENNHDVLKNMFYDQYDDLLKVAGQDPNRHYAWSFEGLLVAMADEIAQRHHDIEDGLIANAIHLSDILELISELVRPYFNQQEKRLFNSLKKEKSTEYIIPKLSKLIVGCLNRSLINNSISNLKSFYNHYKIKSQKDFLNVYPKINTCDQFFNGDRTISIEDIISYPPELEKDESILKEKLVNNILKTYQVQRMDGKARYIIRQLAKAYLSNPQQLRDSTINQFFRMCYPDQENSDHLSISEKRNWLNDYYYSSDDDQIKHVLLRLVCDFIASMTDDFAIEEHARLYYSSENKYYV